MIIVQFIKLIFAIVYSVLISSIILLSIPFDRNGRLFHALARLHGRGILAGCGVRVIVQGTERVPFTRSYVYVSNHASYFDIPAVVAGIPDQIRIVYKKELERLPIFGWGLKYGKTYIAIDRGRGQQALQSLEEAVRKIREGASVIFFAEGTRTPDGALHDFKRGPFSLAVKAGVPVVPVTIQGSYDVLPRHSWKIRRGTITLTLGRPIEVPSSDGRDAEIELRDRVHAVIKQTLEEGRTPSCP